MVIIYFKFVYFIGFEEGMTYSIDFRHQVLKIRSQEGLTFEEAAQRFGIGKQTIYRWSKNCLPQKTRLKPAIKIDDKSLIQDIGQYPDAYQRERAHRLGVSQRGICWALKRLGVTYKKNSESSQSGSRKKICVLP